MASLDEWIKSLPERRHIIRRNAVPLGEPNAVPLGEPNVSDAIGDTVEPNEPNEPNVPNTVPLDDAVANGPIKAVGDIFIVIGNEAFDLKVDTITLLQGGPTIYARDAFYERFTPDTNIFNTVVKYWRTDRLTAYSPSRSEPAKNTFRVPCLKADADILKEGFTSYQTFLERKVKTFNNTGTDEQHFWEGERDHVAIYISKLKAWNKDDKTCISINEVAEDSSILYYAVIPKLFYLMYLNSQSHVPLDINAIFKKFPTLDNDATEYLKQLTEAGTFETERGLYDMATGVVELFYMLPKLFPDLYGHLIPDQASAEQLAALLKSGKSLPTAIESVGNNSTASLSVGVGNNSTASLSVGVGNNSIGPIVNIDDLLKGVKFPDDLKELISIGLKAALQAYTEKDTKKVTNGIHAILQYLDGYMGKLNEANVEIEKLRDEVNTLKEDEINGLLSIINTNAETITTQAEKINTQVTIIKELTNSITQSQGTTGDIIIQLQTTLDALVQNSDELEKTKQELESNKETILQVTENNTDLKEQFASALASATAAAAAAATAAQAALDTANAADAAAKTELEAAKAKATEDLNKAQQDATTAAAAAGAQVATLMAELEELQNKSDNDKTIVGDLHARLEAAIAAQNKALSEAEAATAAALAAKTAAAAASDKASAADARRLAETKIDTEKLKTLSTEAIEIQGLVKVLKDDKARLEGQVTECGNSKSKLYSDIMSNIKEQMTALRDAVPNLKKPSDLPAALTTQLEKPDVAYNSTKELDEQANIQNIYEEMEALRLYLSALNSKYGQWIDAFENKSKTRTRDKQNLTPEQKDALFKFLYDVIGSYTKVGATKADFPDAIYNGQIIKNDVLTKDLMTPSVNVVLNTVLHGIRLPESATSNHEKFLSILITTHTKASKNSAELNRLRRFVMILFKLAYRFINLFFCKDEECADAYIDDVYDNFNAKMTQQDNKSMMNTIFNKESAGVIKDLFYLYLISDPSVDQVDSIFWSRGTDAHAIVTSPKYFYNIDWTNPRAITDFYNKMYNELDTRIAANQNKMYKASGGSIQKQINVSPHDLTPILAEQKAWHTMSTARNDLEPEYQKLLPEADPAPIQSLVEPFNKYIAENADPEELEEARNAVGMMSKEDIDVALNDDMNTTEPLMRVTPMYKKALPRVGKAWIPVMVRADMLRTLLHRI